MKCVWLYLRWLQKQGDLIKEVATITSTLFTVTLYTLVLKMSNQISQTTNSSSVYLRLAYMQWERQTLQDF